MFILNYQEHSLIDRKNISLQQNLTINVKSIRETMTKAEMVREIADKTGIEKQVVMQIVEGMMESIRNSMINGEEVFFTRLRLFHYQAESPENGP